MAYNKFLIYYENKQSHEVLDLLKNNTYDIIFDDVKKIGRGR